MARLSHTYSIPYRDMFFIQMNHTHKIVNVNKNKDKHLTMMILMQNTSWIKNKIVTINKTTCAMQKCKSDLIQPNNNTE